MRRRISIKGRVRPSVRPSRVIFEGVHGTRCAYFHFWIGSSIHSSQLQVPPQHPEASSSTSLSKPNLGSSANSFAASAGHLNPVAEEEEEEEEREEGEEGEKEEEEEDEKKVHSEGSEGEEEEDSLPECERAEVK